MHMESEVEAVVEETVLLELLSYSDWEDGEATPHMCSIFSDN